MMRHLKFSIPLLAVIGVAGLFVATSPTQAASGEEAVATINQYCTGCHSDVAKLGGITLQHTSIEAIAEDPGKYEMAVRKLRGRVMPPPGSPQPEGAAVDTVIDWLVETLDQVPDDQKITDEVLLHRLNRKEYQNAVRDLLLVDIDGSQILPEDDSAQGFDNIASALQVSPSFIEQYVIAARNVALLAMGNPTARPQGWSFRAEPGRQLTHVPGLPLGTRGGILAEVDLPADGEYRININDMATHIWGNGMEYENPLVVTLDNRIVYDAIIGGEEDAKAYDQVQSGALDKVNARLKDIKFLATAGPHKIGVTFRRKSFAESDDRLQQEQPGGGNERAYPVRSFQLLGPFDVSGMSTTPSRDLILTCKPGQNGMTPEACARKIFGHLSKLAYRRPVTDQDVDELMMYYADGAKIGGFEGGIRAGITGMLASPFFLYRGEHVPADLQPGDIYRIDDLELASKLSFFLWSSIPDEQLLDDAIAGKLSDRKYLDAEVDRMLADPRSITLASDFVPQWLDMKRLDTIVPDTDVFPYASGRMDPREDFRTELTLFADSIFREDRSIIDLMDADWTFLNERVALHYGITDVKGDKFQRVKLDNSTRFGLLGKGAVLMAAAYPNRTSPVLRGNFILEHILGIPKATPPAAVPALDESKVGTTEAKTVREMMALHRASPTCSACHSVMDPLGFALENFDATGRWRDRDRYAGSGIDSAGVLPDGTPINGPDDLREALLRRPEHFAQTFVEGLMTYAMGRTREYYDMPTIRQIVRDTAADNYKFSSIVKEVVNSDEFMMRRVPEPVQTASN